MAIRRRRLEDDDDEEDEDEDEEYDEDDSEYGSYELDTSVPNVVKTTSSDVDGSRLQVPTSGGTTPAAKSPGTSRSNSPTLSALSSAVTSKSSDSAPKRRAAKPRKKR